MPKYSNSMAPSIDSPGLRFRRCVYLCRSWFQCCLLPGSNHSKFLTTCPQRPPQEYARQELSFQPPLNVPEKPGSKRVIYRQMFKNFMKEMGAMSENVYQQAKQELSPPLLHPAGRGHNVGELRASNAGIAQPPELQSIRGQSIGGQPNTGEQTAEPRDGGPRIMRKPVGNRITELGTRAMDAARSDKGKKLLSSAASALNLIASMADPTDPDTAGLKMLNSVVQSGVKRSRAKQLAKEAGTREIPDQIDGGEMRSEPSSAVELTPDNPLANMKPEQLAVIIALASRMQAQQDQEARARPAARQHGCPTLASSQ